MFNLLRVAENNNDNGTDSFEVKVQRDTKTFTK